MVIVDLTREQVAPEAPSGASTGRSLLDIFAATVKLHGPRVAIDAEDATLTYNGRALAVEELANTLREHGVGPGDRVGVRLQSGGSQLYVAILGVLTAGAAYVPVDADDPPARTVTRRCRRGCGMRGHDSSDWVGAPRRGRTTARRQAGDAGFGNGEIEHDALPRLRT